LAAEAAWDAGQPDRARELIVRALRFADHRLRARLLQLRGVIEARGAMRASAVATLREAVELSDDPSQQLEMLLEAAEAAGDTGDTAAVRELSARAAALAPRTIRDELSRAVLTGLGALLADDGERAQGSFRDVMRIADDLADDPRAQMWAANAASMGSDLGAGLPFASRAVELTRTQGLLSLLPNALEGQAMEALWSGRLDVAYAAADEGRLLSLDANHDRAWHLAVMAWVEAIRGRETDARRHIDEVLARAQQIGETFLTTTARVAGGLLELGAGRPEVAAQVLLPIVSADRGDVSPVLAMSSVPDAVEAVVRAGLSLELAQAPIARFRAWTGRTPTAARRSLLARCEALVEERPPDEAFRESLELSSALSPFQKARSELLCGEWLRRQRKRTDARAHLRTAAELFRSLGADPWEERAEAELRATGETARKRAPSTLDELTPQELHISQLVAEGMTNREIAAQLYLSPHTIEYHLRKVFTKLGIASRTELIRSGPPV
jgi:DNA-binding CsgD family transcriptional regulator